MLSSYFINVLEEFPILPVLTTYRVLVISCEDFDTIFKKNIKTYGGVTYKNRKEKIDSFLIVYVEDIGSRLSLPYTLELKVQRKWSVPPS